VSMTPTHFSSALLLPRLGEIVAASGSGVWTSSHATGETLRLGKYSVPGPVPALHQRGGAAHCPYFRLRHAVALHLRVHDPDGVGTNRRFDLRILLLSLWPISARVREAGGDFNDTASDGL